jgi:hypothetical protein
MPRDARCGPRRSSGGAAAGAAAQAIALDAREALAARGSR